MQATEIRDMKIKDIQVELEDAREELMRFRFQLTTGELTDHNQIKLVRRNIARMKTILAERANEEDGE